MSIVNFLSVYSVFYERKDLTDHVAAFFDGEERMLVRIIEDRDDDLIEKRLAPFDDVEMTVRRRIERAGEYCTTHIVFGLGIFQMRITRVQTGSELEIGPTLFVFFFRVIRVFRDSGFLRAIPKPHETHEKRERNSDPS